MRMASHREQFCFCDSFGHRRTSQRFLLLPVDDEDAPALVQMGKIRPKELLRVFNLMKDGDEKNDVRGERSEITCVTNDQVHSFSCPSA